MFVLVNLLGEKYPIIVKHLGCGGPNSSCVNLVWKLNKSFFNLGFYSIKSTSCVYFILAVRSSLLIHDIKEKLAWKNYLKHYQSLLKRVMTLLFDSLYIITGDSNARCSRWGKNDSTNSSGQELASLTLSAG